MTAQERMLGALWGSVTGDALGVPVEFKARDEIRANPVIGMRGYGTHHQPPGTWSDDSSLLLCSVESLATEEFNLDDMGRRFVGWFRDFLWTPHGEAFDVGMATADALMRIERGTPAAETGGRGEYDNGNGSLMRIIPVALRFAATPRDLLLDRVQRASAITHAHPRSSLACALHALLVTHLLHGTPASHAWDLARSEFQQRFGDSPEFAHFSWLMNDRMECLDEGRVVSTGYVLHTLHAAVWALLTTGSFKDCVLRAVNLGGDTDTTGCVAGGLAGLLYGVQSVPKEWIDVLARKADLEGLFQKFLEGQKVFMTPKSLTSNSKFLSLVLRHRPETIEITLDAAGWVGVDDLLAALAKHGRKWSRADLEEIVRTSDKQRFALSPDGNRIRANQGHSVDVELGHEPAVPPELLYHGTTAQFISAIRQHGLRKMQRHHVHLSAETEVTLRVGARRGRPILLTIRAGDMHRAGHAFFLTPNQVWLTDHVSPEFITFGQDD